MQPQARPYIVPLCLEQIEILYRDEHMLLVGKPPWLLTVPGRLPENSDCVISRLQKDFPTATIVHRLDLDTSGLLMIPLCHAVHADLTRQFQRRAIHKRYEAVVYGIVEQDEGEIDFPLARDWFNKPLQKICAIEGKPALTRYRVLARDAANNRTRLALFPVTGRSHQLRIHLAEIGHPILGCDLYAHDEAFHMAKRLMLHATELKFTHPITGDAMHQICPVPF